MISGVRTVDGMRIRVVVNRTITVLLGSQSTAERFAGDCRLLGCTAVIEGLTVRVSGHHEVLGDLERSLG